ncbi:PIG-L family deacetylase [Hymenobacter rubripertinctus]|uniref:PIG-L family deacetylase n=1 Tax=Hymenobacter rubripertinctus TaxID=2029981 RepID=UPI001600C160|nr:PIG-L family deacetylase [Hymenobacter rubripertinctus]
MITAHPDDWQLFMGAAVCAEAQHSRRKVVLICLTGGQANEPSDTYWRGREAGHLASVRKAVDLGPTATPGAVVSTAATIVVNGHSIETHRYQNTISCYLHLPDGGVDGKGLVRGGGQSLKQLREAGKAIKPLDGGAAYTSWEELSQTIRALLAYEAVEAGRLTIHCPQPDERVNPIDHSDHRLAGLLALEATRQVECRYFQYAGYTIMRNPTNLTVTQQSWQMQVYRAYCQTMDAAGYPGAWDEKHLKFIGRQYAQVKHQTGTVLRPTAPAPAATSDEDEADASKLVLEPCYPNPVTVSGVLAYQLPVQEAVWLRILDIQGRVVQELQQGSTQTAGRHEQWLDLQRFPATGVYFAELRAGGQRRLCRVEVAR